MCKKTDEIQLGKYKQMHNAAKRKIKLTPFYYSQDDSEKITHIYDVQGMISENMSIMFNNYPLPLFKP